jgi:hypothetical protein
MAQIPLNEQFIGLSASVDMTERRSAIINAQSQAYTMQDVIDTVEAELPPSAPQLYIASLDQSGTNPPTTTNVVADFVPTTVNRNSAGYYTFLFPAGTFTAKTIATINLQGSNPVGLVGVVGLTLNWDFDRIDIVTKNPAAGTPGDGYLSGARLSVQVYE